MGELEGFQESGNTTGQLLHGMNHEETDKSITPGDGRGLKLALNLLVLGSNVEHSIKVGDALLSKNKKDVDK